MIRPPTNDSDYYLIANAKQHNWTPTRSGGQRPVQVVIHTAEAKNLTSGLPRSARKVDNTAENVARYGATTTRKVSWHVTVDADSVVWCLPDRIKAWHAGRLNSQSLGIELACRSTVWGRATTSDDWTNAILERAAGVVAYWCQTYDIPAERITREQALRKVAGIIGHGDADPTRRSDPGRLFPWAQFLRSVREAMAPPQPAQPAAAANASPVSQTTGTVVTDGVPILTAAEITKLRERIAND